MRTHSYMNLIPLSTLMQIPEEPDNKSARSKNQIKRPIADTHTYTHNYTHIHSYSISRALQGNPPKQDVKMEKNEIIINELRM